MKILDKVPEPWLTRFKTLGAVRNNGVKAVVLVGGCVRDMILGRAPADWDVLADGDAGPLLVEAEKRFQVAKTVRHAAFLTATVHFSDGTALDVATARTETYPRPAALPVVKPAPLAEDFHRRDFTVNAMAVHLTPDRWGELEDPLRGREDLEKGTIRALHDRSFSDDPTRIFRAARYAGRYGWTVEPRTMDRIREALRENLPALLSPARRRNELTHLLTESDAGLAMKLLWDWGAWKYWSPSFHWTPAVATALSAPSDAPLIPRLAALADSGDRETARRDLAGLTYSHRMLKVTT